jgi:serralysin
MADRGATALSFTPSPLPYTITGLPITGYGGHSLLFQKSNGTYEIALWYEQRLWSNSTFAQIPPAIAPITVNLGGAHGTVNVYDPVIGAMPLISFSNVSSVNLTLGADLLIVEVVN